MTKQQIEKKIEEVRAEIKRLEEEELTLKKQLRQIITNENTKLLLEEIYNVNKNNTQFVQLYSDTRTTPIMDKFYHSNDRFLVFEKIFMVGKNWTRASLVVVKGDENIKVVNSGLTMTDLKKSSGRAFSERSMDTISKSSRFYTLAKEIVNVSDEISIGMKKIPFKNPIRLGGQTFDNQTGYGSEYEGTYKVTQGTLYGETTSFYIIGIML